MPTEQPELQQLDSELVLMHGRVSPISADIYAQLPRPPGHEAWQLTGSVSGPYVDGSRTLPATVPLVDRGAGPTWLSGGTIPDPCVWSPNLPALYRIHLELRGPQNSHTYEERWYGISGWGTDGQHLRIENKRHVLRFVGYCGKEPPWEFCRESMTALWCTEPTLEFCEQASRRGVRMIGDFRDATDVSRKLAEVACWPAVVAAFLPSDFASEGSHGNLLCGQFLENEHEPVRDWADMIAVPQAALRRELLEGLPDVPRLIIDRGRIEPLEDARQACDRLQSRCADRLQAAGYGVLPA